MDKRTVISFSLYGNVNKYIGGLLENCKDINRIYPDFWIYIYLGNDFDWTLFCEKFNNIQNIKYIETGCSGHLNMLHRFLSIDYDEVAIAFSRDCDSRINERDQYCINQFIKSDKKFQIIRDNPQHGVKILGGMWGIKKGLLKTTMKNLLNNYDGNKVGDDQIFLGNAVYPLVRDDLLVFDEFFHFPKEYPEKINVHPFEIHGMRNHVGYPYMPKNLNDPFGEHGKWYQI